MNNINNKDELEEQSMPRSDFDLMRALKLRQFPIFVRYVQKLDELNGNGLNYGENGEMEQEEGKRGIFRDFFLLISLFSFICLC